MSVTSAPLAGIARKTTRPVRTDQPLAVLVVLAVVMVIALPGGIRVVRNAAFHLSHRTRYTGVFTDVTKQAGLAVPRPGPGAPPGAWRMPISGQAWGDVNSDGFIDLYVTNQDGPNTLYMNNGDGTFSVSPYNSDVALPASGSSGAVFADYDNDGWPDLYVASYGGQHLFHNDQGHGFHEVPLPPLGAHVAVLSGSWADYDNDGRLDLFVATYGCIACSGPLATQVTSSRLYHNDGGDKFTDVTDLLPVKARTGFTFMGVWLDFTNGGRPGLYLAKDVFGWSFLPTNALIRNDGPGCGGWCFTDVSRGSGANIRADAMGVAVGDYRNSGNLDIYFSNSGLSSPSTGPPRLLLNTGNSHFRDVQTAGVNADAFSWGTEFLDFDSDGQLDLYLAVGNIHPRVGNSLYPPQGADDRLFRNQGNGTFASFTNRSGTLTDLATIGVAVADYNNDGRPDVVVGDYDARYHVGYRLFANTGVYGQGNHRLKVRLQGGGGVNRDAVGARVEITTSDGRSQMRDVRIGSGLGGGSDTALLFGLGKASPVRMSVRWPDGTQQSFTDLRTDSSVMLTYGGEPAFTALANPRIPTHLVPRPAGHDIGATGLAGAAIAILCTLAFSILLGRTLTADDPLSAQSEVPVCDPGPSISDDDARDGPSGQPLVR